METQGTNLFIVDDDNLIVTTLKKYLQDRFGNTVKISTFNDGESCLKKVDKETQIVILDYFMEGKNGLETLKSIKEINPETEVIMLSTNEDVAVAVESFKMGAKDYVIKGEHSWDEIFKTVHYIVTAPLRLLVEEFGVSKFMAIFLLTFISMGIIVLAAYFYIR